MQIRKHQYHSYDIILAEEANVMAAGDENYCAEILARDWLQHTAQQLLLNCWRGARIHHHVG